MLHLRRGIVLLRGGTRGAAPASASVRRRTLRARGTTKANGCAVGRAPGLAVASLTLPGCLASAPHSRRHTERRRAQPSMHLLIRWVLPWVRLPAPARPFGHSRRLASSAAGAGTWRSAHRAQTLPHLSRPTAARCRGISMLPAPRICWLLTLRLAPAGAEGELRRSALGTASARAAGCCRRPRYPGFRMRS